MAPLMRPVLIAALGLLVACDQDPYLPGERFDVIAPTEVSAPGDASAPAISLPKMISQAQAIAPSGVVGPTVHATLAKNASLKFTTQVGVGNSKRARLTAAPIVADGLVYAIDSASTVTAVNAQSGQIVWSRSIAPKNDQGTELIGGGLSFGDSRLYATSAFGEVHALDPSTGDEIWVQKLGAAANGAPSYAKGHVFIVSATGAAWKVNAKTGRIAWRLVGDEQTSGTFGGAAPAVSGGFVIFANSAGEVVNSYQNGGTLAWINKLAGANKGSAISAIEDIAGSPIVAGGDLYVSNFGGRTARYNLSNGETKWLAPIGTYNTPLAVGNSLFIVTNDNELARVSMADGSVIWSEKLPKFTSKRTRKRSEIFVHYGPVLAGGSIVLASSDGLIRFIDPQSGTIERTLEIAHGAATPPVVANSTLYVINTRGELLAFQ